MTWVVPKVWLSRFLARGVVCLKSVLMQLLFLKGEASQGKTWKTDDVVVWLVNVFIVFFKFSFNFIFFFMRKSFVLLFGCKCFFSPLWTWGGRGHVSLTPNRRPPLVSHFLVGWRDSSFAREWKLCLILKQGNPLYFWCCWLLLLYNNTKENRGRGFLANGHVGPSHRSGKLLGLLRF